MVSLTRWTVLAMAAGFVLSCASQASAWGDDGHRIVCRIAFRLLDETRQKAISDLREVYHRPNKGPVIVSFEEACLFADEARRKARAKLAGWTTFAKFNDWHYLNVPRETHLIADSHCKKDCLLAAISEHIGGLKATDRIARAEALFFLAHWVGDIHQPLHISYESDAGGNDISVNGGFFAPVSMHSVWDTEIIKKAQAPDTWGPYADRLAAAITPAEHDSWIASPPLVWAQESYNITTRPSAQYCRWRDANGVRICGRIGPPGTSRTLAAPYQVESADDVAQRLQQAGARLADVIRRNLALSP